jgi:hypothetical protein
VGLVVRGETPLGVIGNSVLTEAAFDKAGIRDGCDVRTNPEARKAGSSCDIVVTFENRFVKPSIKIK